jgi:serine phosphatase RsbU (regulator of sigma subunit)
MKHGLNISQEYPDLKLAAVWVMLFIFICGGVLPAQNQREIDSLERLLPFSAIDTPRLHILNELSAQLVDVDPAKAIRHAEEALKLAEKLNHKALTATSLLNIGNGHYNLAEYKLALFYYLKALHIQEALGNKKGILSASGSIGNVFLDMRQPEQGLKYFLQTLAISRELNNKRGTASALISIGTVYSDKKDFKKALEYCFEALELFKEIDYPEAVATCYNNIADDYHNLKDYPKAMIYITKAYETYKEIGNVYGMALALNNLGDFYASTGDPEKALAYYERGLEQAKLIGASDRIIAAYRGISISYKKMGRFQDALEVSEKYQKMNDSIYNIESSKQIAEMQTRFETEKKAKEIDLLTKDKKIQEEELLRQRQISWTMAIAGILVLFLALLAIRANLQKRKANKELEVKNRKIEAAYNIIESQHKDIKDSIHYAERLQNAILPTTAFSQFFGVNAFVLYKPKDIVSGDFYWIELHDGPPGRKVLFAAVDCTGHGVPGAFMSIVGHNLLRQAVKDNKTKPSEILDELNSGLSETLNQTLENSTVKDGMDIALCALSEKADGSKILEFAGANNPLWIIRKDSGKVEEIKGDKFPIGVFIGEEMHKFANHTLEVFPGDTLYVFTDGYADQFGGGKGKKFKYKPLQELLLSISNRAMPAQRTILEENFLTWKGGLEQVDDILIIGIRIS